MQRFLQEGVIWPCDVLADTIAADGQLVGTILATVGLSLRCGNGQT